MTDDAPLIRKWSFMICVSPSPPGYDCISVKASMTVKIIREKIKMLTRDHNVSSASEMAMTKKRTKIDDAKKRKSTVRLCFYEFASYTTGLWSLQPTAMSRTMNVCPYNRNEELTQRSWNDCLSRSRLSANTEYFYRMRKFQLLSYIRY